MIRFQQLLADYNELFALQKKTVESYLAIQAALTMDADFSLDSGE